MDDGNGKGNGNECKGVKMESRGKLGNDGKVKFVRPRKIVKWREKAYGLPDISKSPFSISLPLS